MSIVVCGDEVIRATAVPFRFPVRKLRKNIETVVKGKALKFQHVTPLGALLLSVILSLVGCQSPATTVTSQDPNGTRQAFFKQLAELEGQRFEGKVVYMIEPAPPFDGARLVMHVESVTEQEIRIPFHVDEDRSRTWILQIGNQGLLFKHDHRHPDGTPDDVTNYGGWATDAGTSHRQHFPADGFTAELLPEAATNVWTIELRPDGALLVYELSRHAAPRFRAEFDLTQPIE